MATSDIQDIDDVFLSLPVTLEIDNRNDYWACSIKGLGVLVCARTYNGAIDRAIKAFNFLLAGLIKDGIDLGVYFVVHGFDCKPMASISNPPFSSPMIPSDSPFHSQMMSSDLPLFSLNGRQAIPLEGKVRVPG